MSSIPRTVTAAIYLRVSTADQGKHGFSIPEQRKACLRKAEELAAAAGAGVTLETHEFLDTAGGDLLERPELERARAFVKECRPAYFICLDPDRFSRATYQAILVANEIEAAGVALEFVQHDYQATSEGRLFFTLRVAIAEYEKAKILERTQRGKRGKMAAGGIPHHMRVYGYDHLPESERQARLKAGEPDPGALVPNPTEAAWVGQVFKWLVEEGIGSQAIAERLNGLGVPAKNGGMWRRGVVADILRNPIYIGRLRLNRYDFRGLGGQLQLPKDRRTRKLTPRQRPPDEWITVAVPSLVDEELFARAQILLRTIRRRSSTRLHPGRKGHLLSGLLTCGICGAPVHYVWNNRINGYLLRCGNKYPQVRGAKVDPPRCPTPHQKAVKYEEMVWRRIYAWVDDPELLAEDRPTKKLDEYATRESFLHEQIREAKSRQSKILYLAGKGVVHPEVAESQLAEIMRSLKAMERELADLEVAMKRTRQEPKENCDAPDELLASMEDLNLEQRQTLVRLLIREVRVHPGGEGEIEPIS